MKKNLFLLFALGLLMFVSVTATAGSLEQWINTGWKFHRADLPEMASFQSPDFNDAAWDTVTLPHSPRIEKHDETHPWQGICWYRKVLAPHPEWAGKCVSVQFGAAMQIADVWVNGRLREHHLGGYLPFTVDLREEAAAGQPIVIAVRLDNRDTDLVPPGKPTDGLDFNYPGGLYRGVKLIVTDSVHVTDPVAANIVAGGGVFVTYSDVSETEATVHVKTDVANDGGDLARKCSVRSVLLDASGLSRAEAMSDPVMLPADAHHEFAQQISVERPHLWHPDHPYLYTLVTTVFHDGAPVDEVRTPIGIRTIQINPRVTINGQEFHIAGSNRHQEYPYIEYALSPSASRRDAQCIKDGGFSHIRLSHYPQDPAFLDACDELGILVQAPIPGWQQFQFNSSFVAASFQNIRDLIRRDRNHPCILFWEPNLNETDGDHQDWCEAAYEIAHQEYPGPECYTFGDPYPGGWRGWDVKHFAREYGDFGFGGNESTSRHVRGDGETAMLQQAWNFQWCHNQSWASWENPHAKFQGDATWCMFDYNRGYYPKQEQSGMMDIFRLPKYVYHFFQSQRDPAFLRPDMESGPLVFIANEWTPRPSPAKVVVYSNCEEIELSVNGKIIRRQKPDSGPDTRYSEWNADIAKTTGNNYDNTGGHPFDGGNAKHLDHAPFTFFNVPYTPGSLKAVGYIAGKPAAEYTVRTPEKPTALKLEFDTRRNPLTADGADAIFVRANIVDAHGTIVPFNTLPSLQFTVKGAARLIGTTPIHVEAGVASVLLQARTEPGPVTVTASADGLQGATATIITQPAETERSRTPLPPAPKPARVLPASFTKLHGTVIGTKGAFKNGPVDIAKAFDGDTATYVDASEDTGGDDCWLGLDLGLTAHPVTKIRFYPRTANSARMWGGKFQGSDTADFAKPFDLAVITALPKEGAWSEITEIATNRPMRFVRYLSPEDGWNNVAEVEFYTSP